MTSASVLSDAAKAADGNADTASSSASPIEVTRLKRFFKNAIFSFLSVVILFLTYRMANPCAEQHMGTTSFTKAV